MIKWFTIIVFINLLGSFSSFSQNIIQNNLKKLDSLLDIQGVTEDFLYMRYECPSIKVDSSLKVEKFILNLEEVNCVLDSLLLNYKLFAKESIVLLYDKLIDKTTSPHSSLLIHDIYNRAGVYDCDHNSLFLSDYKSYWGAVSKFEHIILTMEIKSNQTLTPFMAYELLSDEYYDKVVKKKSVQGKFPYYSQKITDIIGSNIRNVELFWRSDYKAIKTGYLNIARNINLDSSNKSSDYLKDVFLIRQRAYFLQNNPIPELELIFRERLEDWVDNGFLYFVLQTTPQRSDSIFIKKLVLKILYSNIQEGYMDNDDFMRALVVGGYGIDNILDILLSEASKKMTNSDNPALKYLEKIYDPSVHDFLLENLENKKTNKYNKILIRHILSYQYDNLIKFKRENSDRVFTIW